MHRSLYRVTAGRIGLWRPKGNRWGAMRVTAAGRRTGRRRSVIVGYFEDGPDLVTMAMNGWGDGEPAWWLNLQAHPDAEVRLADGPRLVRARWREIDNNLDAYAALRSTETAVVVFEPRPEPLTLACRAALQVARCRARFPASVPTPVITHGAGAGSAPVPPARPGPVLRSIDPG